jgi:hypothetical protein
MTSPMPDFRTDRVALKIDALIPELQELVEMLRETVAERNAEQGGAYPEEGTDDGRLH